MKHTNQPLNSICRRMIEVCLCGKNQVENYILCCSNWRSSNNCHSECSMFSEGWGTTTTHQIKTSNLIETIWAQRSLPSTDCILRRSLQHNLMHVRNEILHMVLNTFSKIQIRYATIPKHLFAHYGYNVYSELNKGANNVSNKITARTQHEVLGVTIVWVH